MRNAILQKTIQQQLADDAANLWVAAPSNLGILKKGLTRAIRVQGIHPSLYSGRCILTHKNKNKNKNKFLWHGGEKVRITGGIFLVLWHGAARRRGFAPLPVRALPFRFTLLGEG